MLEAHHRGPFRLFLLVLLSLAMPLESRAQAALEEPVYGICWPKQSKLKGAAKDAVLELREGWQSLAVLDVGEWNSGTLGECERLGVTVLLKLKNARVKAKSLETKTYRDGGDEKVLKFIGAEASAEIDVQYLSTQPKRLKGWSEKVSISAPLAMTFGPGEKLKEQRTDPRELLRGLVRRGVYETFELDHGLHLWASRAELPARFAAMTGEQRTQFWLLTTNSMTRRLDLCWPHPRHTVFGLLREDLEQMKGLWASSAGDQVRDGWCGWCGEDCEEEPCSESSHFGALMNAARNIRYAVNSSPLPSVLRSGAPGFEPRGLDSPLEPSDIGRAIEMSTYAQEFDRRFVQLLLEMKVPRRRPPPGKLFIVVRVEDPAVLLDGLDPDLYQAAAMLSFVLAPDSDRAKDWKIKKKGDFVALVEMGKSGTSYKNAKAVKTLGGNLDAADLEELLLRLLHDRYGI